MPDNGLDLATVQHMAHELRAPLTTLTAASRTLQLRGERLEPADRSLLAGDLAAEADRLALLVDAMVAIAGQPAGVAEPVALGPAVAASLKRSPAGDRIRLTVTGGWTVAADPQAVDRLVRWIAGWLLRHTESADIAIEPGEATAAIVWRWRGPPVDAEAARALAGDRGAGDPGLAAAARRATEAGGSIGYTHRADGNMLRLELPLAVD